jgi:hypothetical protein
MSNTPCDVKVLYDTEFEAERASSIASYEFGSEMIHYRCGSHWHIANKSKFNRSKYRKFNRTWCDVCEVYMKPQNYDKHVTLVGHQRRAYKKGIGNDYPQRY